VAVVAASFRSGSPTGGTSGAPSEVASTRTGATMRTPSSVAGSSDPGRHAKNGASEFGVLS
jgi:type IV secretory pathway TrbL component